MKLKKKLNENLIKQANIKSLQIKVTCTECISLLEGLFFFKCNSIIINIILTKVQIQIKASHIGGH